MSRLALRFSFALAAALLVVAAHPSASDAAPKRAKHATTKRAKRAAPKRAKHARKNHHGRLGIPSDGVVKGIYVRGSTAGRESFPALLDRVAAHGMNAIVLDVKDYDGKLTYPSKVPLAVSAKASEHAPIDSFSRVVRLAHERGVRVVARISCFHDQLMAKAHPSLAIRGISGHVYHNGWLDPTDHGAQRYIVALVKEAIGHGADEIELDYVRFPVQHTKYIDFGLDTRKDPRAKVHVISRFVEEVHAVTKAHHVPLSLDVFGVIAFGHEADIQNLGQDPAELATRAEFLSPMVYPSHYSAGFMGWESPGDHPEIVGIGVREMKETIRGAGVKRGAIIRPWLQAMRYKSATYGPDYIRKEIRSGEHAGAKGWLMWNPGQRYGVTWRAVPRRRPVEARR